MVTGNNGTAYTCPLRRHTSGQPNRDDYLHGDGDGNWRSGRHRFQNRNGDACPEADSHHRASPTSIVDGNSSTLTVAATNATGPW